jgi:hypothetical protein
MRLNVELEKTINYFNWITIEYISNLYRSIEQNVLITNIILLFKSSLATREILNTFVRPKNQFLT